MKGILNNRHLRTQLPRIFQPPPPNTNAKHPQTNHVNFHSILASHVASELDAQNNVSGKWKRQTKVKLQNKHTYHHKARHLSKSKQLPAVHSISPSSHLPLKSHLTGSSFKFRAGSKQAQQPSASRNTRCTSTVCSQLPPIPTPTYRLPGDPDRLSKSQSASARRYEQPALMCGLLGSLDIVERS